MKIRKEFGRLVVGVMALGAATGCTSIDEAVAQHGKAAEASLVRIEAVRTALEAQPLLAGEGLETGGASLVVDLSDSVAGSAQANTAVVYVEDLAELGALGPIYARDRGTLGVSRCASFARHRTEPWDPRKSDRWNDGVLGSTMASRLEACGKLTHLLVIRTVELARPGSARIELAPGATSPPLPAGTEVTEATCGTTGWHCAFEGGYIKAEVHLFSLDPVQHRGGVTLTVESTDRLHYPSSSTGIDKALEDDLQAAFETALASALGGKARVVR